MGAELAVGRFDAADEADPTRTAELVEAALTDVPWQHQVVLRAQSTPEAVARALPAGLATVAPLPPDEAGADAHAGADQPRQPWTRVELRAQRLDWLPGVLLTLPGAFTVVGPQALRDLLQHQGHRLLAASATSEHR